MNFSDDRMVLRIKNNISALVMNKTDIQKKIRIYFKARYDTDTSEI